MPQEDLPLPRALRGDVARREYSLRRRDGSLGTILVTKALQQLGRLSRLVDDLLEYAGVEAGHLDLVKSANDLNEVVSDVVEQFRLGAAPAHEVVLHRPPGSLLVEIDRRRIEAVLVNLLHNAVKYSPNAPRIDVDVTADPHEVVVSVRDRGIGIPRDDVPKVFRRFFRARNAAATHYAGLGIGLFVCSEVLRQHGGAIELDSGEGQGSTFSFRLPRLARAVGEDAAPRRRILMVDDGREILDAASAFLEDEGYDVDRAEDGIEALERLKAGGAPDLMLLDLMRPRLDGRGLLRQMRQARVGEGVPVVLVSASAQLPAAQASFDVDATLVKPFSLGELEAVVRRFLRAEPRA